MIENQGADVTHSRRPFRKNIALEGDTVILSCGKNETQPIKLSRGAITQNRCGAVKHNDVIGKPYGSRVSSISLKILARFECGFSLFDLSVLIYLELGYRAAVYLFLFIG